MFFVAAILDKPWYIDELIRSWTNEINNPGLDVIFQALTHLGSPTAFILLGVLVFIYLWIWGHIRQGIILDVGLITAWAVMKFLKNLVGRERPPGEHLTAAAGMSFPSGHAMLSLVFYGFIACLLLIYCPSKYGKITAYILFIVIGLIGFSRIYLNVHYATDVAAGFIFGLVILAIMIKVSRRGQIM